PMRQIISLTSLFHRSSSSTQLFTLSLHDALPIYNDWLTEEYCDSAIKTLLAYTSSSSLMQINREKYGMLRDGIPIKVKKANGDQDRKSTRLNSSHVKISYAVFCLKQKTCLRHRPT